MPASGTCSIGFRELRVSRRGHRLDECEDASAAAPERGRFALADGAAESFLGGLWARLLVEDFVRADEPHPDWREWLPPLQARWAEQASPSTGSGEQENGTANALPWYLESRLLQQGAFATFLGLVVDGHNWSAVAVGDTCLFQVRDGQLELAFPLTRAEDFHSSPWLIGSRQSPAGVPCQQSVRVEGDWRGGDRLWMMTDALAQWFLKETESGRMPWRMLEEVVSGTDEGFADWVEEQRRAGRLRNDDVTLVGAWLEGYVP
jgi:hypothetical protein